MNIDLGRVTPIYRGIYAAGASYELNDIVLYSDGCLYWHTKPEATTGVAPTDTAAWTLAFSGDDVEAAIEQIKEDAEAIALGTRGGVPVGSSDPYYHNNAAWYASQASASATAAGNAQTAAETAQGKAEDARDKAAQWATGGTTGTPGAENNAKYFSEQAAGSAAAAAASAAASAANTALAEAFDATKQYVPGDLCVYSGGLYVFTSDHLGAWDAADVESTTAEEQLQAARDLALGAYPTETDSSAVASTAVGADGIPVKSIIAQIIPVQAGSGDPSPSNPRAISGWTGANVTRCGGNLWNGQYQNGSINIDTGENESSSTVIRSIGFIPVLPSTVMYQAKGNTGAGFWLFYDEDKNYLSYIDTKYAGEYTTPENAYFLRFIHAKSNFLPDAYGVSFANQATAYSPYSGTVYPVSWQSEAGTVYGGTLRDNGDGTWTLKSKPYYASYNGETLVGPWVSSMDVYAEGVTPTTGAQVVDLGGADTEYTITAESVKTLLGSNNIFADCGDVEVDYRADPTLYIDSKIASLQALILDN